MTIEMFLTPEEIAHLTGRKIKRLQVEQLRTMGIPFYVNAVGAAVVVRSSIERKNEQDKPRPHWQPKVLQSMK